MHRDKRQRRDMFIEKPRQNTKKAPSERHPMANTYTQIYIQIVFAVEGRQNLIEPERKEELHKCIIGIVKCRPAGAWKISSDSVL
jgi:hypothetical protein